MRHVEPHLLWIGHARSVTSGAELRRAGIAAVIDLAMDEIPRTFGRETVVCRFPLVDGGGNPAWVVRAAVVAVAGLIQTRTPTLVFCSAGLSRSPSVAAGGLAVASGREPSECLAEITRGAPADVSPAMWGQVVTAVASIRGLSGLGIGPKWPSESQ